MMICKTWRFIREESDYDGNRKSANEGFSTYMHGKAGTVHSLICENGGSIIRFTATADFANGDSFTVNGIPCTAFMTDGEVLSDDYFVQGTVVTCCKNGSSIYFKTGGAGLNYKIVGGTTTPMSPTENMIWVNTGDPISSHVFSSMDTPSGYDGRVWIKTGVRSGVQMNLLKPRSISPGIPKADITICPLSASQYIGGTWVNRVAKVYQGGVWKNTYVYAYDNSPVPGFTVQTGTSGTGNVTVTANPMRAYSNNSNGGSGWVYVSVDLSGFTTLVMVGNFIAGLYSGNAIGVFQSFSAGSSLSPIVGRAGATSSIVPSVTNATFTFDVSALKGTYLIGGKVYSGSSVSSVSETQFHQIYLY